MVEPLDTVVTDAAVRCPGRSEYLAGEAVLQLHSLTLDLNLLGARWRSVGGPRPVVRLLYLPLYAVRLGSR